MTDASEHGWKVARRQPNGRPVVWKRPDGARVSVVNNSGGFAIWQLTALTGEKRGLGWLGDMTEAEALKEASEVAAAIRALAPPETEGEPS